MRSLVRQLMALVALVVLVVGGLAGLAQLKFSSFLSDSVRERLEIVATTTARDFAAATDLGLKLAEVANGSEILGRARSHDPIIRSIVVLDLDGRVLHSVGEIGGEPVSSETLDGFRLARLGITGPVWSVENDVRIGAGVIVEGAFGQPVGAVVVDYPKSVMSDQESVMAGKLIRDALAVAIGAALLMAIMLPAVRRRMSRSVVPAKGSS